MTTDGATPAEATIPSGQAQTSGGQTAEAQAVPFIDRNHYFGLSYPVGWIVNELADSVGLVVQAPQADDAWRARLRINVRACPRSQTLDRTLYLFRSDMLAKEGVKFEGQTLETHTCGKPAGTLAWSMLRDQTPLRIRQWFIAMRAGIIVQLTASADAGAFARHEAAFNLIANSLRPLKALDQLALLLPKPTGTGAESAAATNPAATSAAKTPTQAPTQKPQIQITRPQTPSPAPRATTVNRAESPIAKSNTDAPKPAPKSEPKASTPAPTQVPAPHKTKHIGATPTAPAAASVPAPVVASAPAPAELEPMGHDEADDAAAVIAAATATPAPAPLAEIDLSLEPSEPVATSASTAGDSTIAGGVTAAKPAEPATTTEPSAATTAESDSNEQASDADDESSNVAGTPAFTRLWVALDLAAKDLVKDVRKEAKKHGLKPCGKALFEARAFALDSLRRGVEQASAGDQPAAAELVSFMEAKVAGRTRLAKLTVAERCEAYAAACPVNDGSFPNPAALEALARNLAQGTGDYAGLTSGLVAVEASAIAPFRKRLAALIAGNSAGWQTLDAASVDKAMKAG
ncbi:MAG: hypothetical protein NTW19_14655 [Planctomycetota bacterium]|nr:hypothetical protein [Planctomycetota bacterium]